jgi:hypothetical protein
VNLLCAQMGTANTVLSCASRRTSGWLCFWLSDIALPSFITTAVADLCDWVEEDEADECGPVSGAVFGGRRARIAHARDRKG